MNSAPSLSIFLPTLFPKMVSVGFRPRSSHTVGQWSTWTRTPWFNIWGQKQELSRGEIKRSQICIKTAPQPEYPLPRSQAPSKHRSGWNSQAPSAHRQTQCTAIYSHSSVAGSLRESHMVSGQLWALRLMFSQHYQGAAQPSQPQIGHKHLSAYIWRG